MRDLNKLNITFFDKLGIRLTILPLLAVILVLAGGVSAFFYMDPSYLLKDYHKLHLVNITSEKKLAVDSWLEYYKRDLANLSRLGLFRDTHSVLIPKEDEAALSPMKKKKLAETRQDAKSLLAGLLTDRVRSGKYNMLAVLATNGRVLASNKQEIEGADWSDRNFFRKTDNASKNTAVIRIGKEAGTNCSIELLTPLFGDNNTLNGMIYSLSEAKDLAGILKIEKAIYRTEKIELIDNEGNVLLTKDGIPVQQTKYNVPAASKDNSVRYKGGVFFYFLGLEDTPFRIIGTVDGSEVMAPLYFLLILYSFCGVMIIIVLLLQAALIVPRLVTEPISRILRASREAAEGNPDADFGEDYRGEMLNLRNTIEALITGMKTKGTTKLEKPEKSGELALEEFDMPEIMKEIEADAKKFTGIREIELIVDYDDALKGKHLHSDRQKLTRAISILVDNAVRCTDIGTITIIASGITKDKLDYVEVSVADTGKGFSPEVLSTLFNESRCPVDCLYLTIAKSMVDALGGKISATSAEGKGSVFTFEIPMRTGNTLN